jgi:hypothetical protein
MATPMGSLVRDAQGTSLPMPAAPSTNGGSGGIDDELRALSAEMLDVAEQAGGTLQETATPISQTALFPFSEYLYLRDVDVLNGAGDPRMTHVVATFIDGARATITDVVDTYAPRPVVFPGPVIPGTRTMMMRFPPGFAQAISDCVRLFTTNAAVGLFELAALVGRGYQGDSGDTFIDVLGALREWLIPRVMSGTVDPASSQFSFARDDAWTTSEAEIRDTFFAMHPDAVWGSVVPSQPSGYPFSLFPAGLVNFGLQLVYSQEWRLLGTQAGEIVRTIPLAPKQTEKMSAKSVVTDRTSRTEESSTSTESTSEADVTNRDASEVVGEASSTFNWHADANAGFSLGPFNAGISGGMSGERASSSKTTKSRLNESVARTATKTTRTVKVMTASEHTSSDEFSRSSEIANENLDRTVTFVYSKLLRQYEIATSLQEVTSVVFVAEPVPAYWEIDEGSVRRYDWILRKSLPDSFAEDLEAISRDVSLFRSTTRRRRRRWTARQRHGPRWDRSAPCPASCLTSSAPRNSTTTTSPTGHGCWPTPAPDAISAANA